MPFTIGALVVAFALTIIWLAAQAFHSAGPAAAAGITAPVYAVAKLVGT